MEAELLQAQLQEQGQRVQAHEQLLQGLQQQFQQQQQQHQQLLTQQQQQQQVQPPGNPVAERTYCNVKLPKYDGTDTQFHRFEQGCRNAVQANRWGWPSAGFAVLSALEGSAVDIARSVVPTDYTDLDAFMVALRQLYVSPAFKRKARSEFLTRLQRNGESPTAFHGELKMLFDLAYDPAERNAGQLIEQFVAGLSHRKAYEQLHLMSAGGNLPTGTNPGDYKDVLVLCLSLIAQYDIMEQEQKRRENGGRGEIERLHLAPPLPAAYAPATYIAGPVPMEIGAVGEKFCNFHKSSTHDTKECKALQQGRNAGPGRNVGYDRPTRQYGPRPNQPQGRPTQGRSTTTSTGPKTQGDREKRQPGQTDQCLNCQGFGHFAAQCPSAKYPRKNTWQHRANAISGQDGDNCYTSDDPQEN